MSSTAVAGKSKRSQYTSRACNQCRRRRCKCDGTSPVCGPCSAYERDCIWGDAEAPRPATKQYIQTLRIKIQSLESEKAALQAAQQPVSQPSVGFSALDESDTLTPGSSVIPSQFRPMSTDPSSQPEQSPWLTYQAEHLVAVGASTVNQPINTTYQFIFNINTSVPITEQPEIHRKSLLCDWSRHLPLSDETQLTRLEHDTLLYRYFRYSSCWLMNIIPQLFLHDMLRALGHTSRQLRTNHYSPSLHCSLLAFATAFSDDVSMRNPTTRDRFATSAKQLLYDELNSLSLPLVQALVMLSEYHYGLGEKEQGYMYLGMSTRAVRALGLGKSQKPRAQAHSEILNWHFWSVFAQDKITASEVNGEFDLRSADYAVQAPLVDWEIDRHSMPYNSGSVSTFESEEPNRLTQVFAESCQLMLFAESILQLHRSSAFKGPTEEEKVRNIHLGLQAWLDGLHAELSIPEAPSSAPLPHIITLNICYWWLILRLHQPILEKKLSQANNDSQSGTWCDRAIPEILRLVDIYNRWHGLGFFPRNMVQVLFTIGNALLYKLKVDAPQDDPSDTRKAILACIGTLRTIAQTWRCAEKLADQLQILLYDQVKGPSV